MSKKDLLETIKNQKMISEDSKTKEKCSIICSKEYEHCYQVFKQNGIFNFYCGFYRNYKIIVVFVSF